MNHPQIQIAILACSLLLAPVGCASDEESGEGDGGQAGNGGQTADSGSAGSGGQTAADAFHFAVFVDPHYYDTDLGTTGSAFESALVTDRKLLAESPAILDATIEALLENQDEIDFVIVPGDLTKDGELSSHEKFIAATQTLEQNGLQVYVCPGNHDINNPGAVSFQGDTTSAVENISPERFAELYADFGYEQAIERHPDSLSYLVEPVEGLWVIALDSCKYQDNLSSGQSEVGGALAESTLSWLEEKVAEAKREGKLAFAIMHHGLVEHFTGQSTMPGIGDEYVIDDWINVSRRVAEAGLSLVFTGHYHAQDVTRQSWEGSEAFVFDVETGSLVSYPNPYRMVSIDTEGRVEIDSRIIDSIDYDTGGQDFPDYSREFLAQGIDLLAEAYITALQVPADTMVRMRPVAIEAFLQHYGGDESADEQTLQEVASFVSDPDPVISLLGGFAEGLLNDLEPADNDVVFNMQTGEVE